MNRPPGSPPDPALDPTLPPGAPAKPDIALDATSTPLPFALDDTAAPPSDAKTPATGRTAPGIPSQINPDYEELQPVDARHYALGDEVARGGMGRILAARDRRLHRPVAVKELLAADSGDFRRFEREALITARLQHPSIVRVYEAGRWPTGQPFYAMELVTGRSFDKVIAKARTLDERLALIPNVLAVTEALAYAHAQHIIHRDLKPNNVLVGAFGETVVIDWGLAKDLLDRTPADSLSARPARPTTTTTTASDGASSDSAALTVAGSVMGTPAYMPPEQARGEPADERADVYALGAILYYVLAGRAPFRGKSSEDVLDQVLAGPPRPLEEAQPGVPPDLLTIVKKAMAIDPSQRYTTARELADDLRRFQTGQLVASHQYSRRTLVARFLRRHRAAVSIGAVAALLLAGGGTLSVARIIRERDRADHERVVAQDARREAEIQREKAVVRADDLTLGQARAALDKDPSTALAWLKELSLDSARWGAAREIALTAQARGIAYVFRGHTDDVGHVRISPDGRTIASASDDHTVRLWDPLTTTSRLLSGHTAKIETMIFSSDGRRIATGSVDQTIRVWDPDSGGSLAFAGHAGTVRALAFSPDGRQLASTSEDKTARLWGPPTLVPAGPTNSQSTVIAHLSTVGRALAWSRDGHTLAIASGDGKILLLDPAAPEKQRLLTGHTGLIRAMQFSPDDKTLASASEDATLRLWDPATGRARILIGHRDAVKDLAFSADGKTLYSASGDHQVRIWDTTTLAPRILSGHEAGIKDIDLSPDGRLLASASTDGTVRLWDLQTSRARVLRGHDAQVKSVAFSPDGKHLASGSDDDTLRYWTLDGTADLPADPTQLRAWLDKATNLTVAAPPR